MKTAKNVCHWPQHHWPRSFFFAFCHILHSILCLFQSAVWHVEPQYLATMQAAHLLYVVTCWDWQLAFAQHWASCARFSTLSVLILSWLALETCICAYVCVCVCKCIYTYVCMYVCIYIYIYHTLHTYAHQGLHALSLSVIKKIMLLLMCMHEHAYLVFSHNCFYYTSKPAFTLLYWIPIYIYIYIYIYICLHEHTSWTLRVHERIYA
jgi:hypothetical protein